MLKGKLVAVILIVAAFSLLGFSACSGQTAIKATWIKPAIAGDLVSIQVSEVEAKTITHFRVSGPTDDLTFMAYQFNGKLHARANICPPCLSDNFSLINSTMVCDTCGTVFDADTGAGKSGPCVAYPKASVSYQISDGNIVMKGADLVSAFQDTLKRG